MRLIIKLLVCLCLLPAGVLCQQGRIQQTMVGPKGDQYRIIVAVVETSPDLFTMQSMIISLDTVKDKKELPDAFFVDLTSTVRKLSASGKNQKILLLQSKKPGAIELKCDGKWVKQDKVEVSIEKIAEVIKTIIRSVPLDAKAPTEVKLPPEIEQKVFSVLDSLQTESLPCLRSVD